MFAWPLSPRSPRFLACSADCVARLKLRADSATLGGPLPGLEQSKHLIDDEFPLCSDVSSSVMGKMAPFCAGGSCPPPPDPQAGQGSPRLRDLSKDQTALTPKDNSRPPAPGPPTQDRSVTTKPPQSVNPGPGTHSMPGHALAAWPHRAQWPFLPS